MNRFQEFLSIVWAFLNPHKQHLNEEIEYLRNQLAQRQRRIDELQEALIEAAKKPAMKIQYKQEPSGKLTPLQPRGWEEYRAQRRQDQAKEGESDAIQGE